jgi:hypothetical protein
MNKAWLILREFIARLPTDQSVSLLAYITGYLADDEQLYEAVESWIKHRGEQNEIRDLRPVR